MNVFTLKTRKLFSRWASDPGSKTNQGHFMLNKWFGFLLILMFTSVGLFAQETHRSSSSNLINAQQTNSSGLCHDITVYLDENGEVDIDVADVFGSQQTRNPITFDTVYPNHFVCDNIGENEVTMMLVLGYVDTVYCTSIVTVIDDIIPTALCQDVSVSLDGNGFAVVNADQVDNGSDDNCNFSLSLVPNQFSCDDLGLNPVTLTVTDDSGNTASCDAVVTVSDDMDPETPQLADVTGECSATAVAPTTTDNCAGTVTGTTSDALTYSTQGTFHITWNFADGNGNDIDVIQTVIVNDITDPACITKCSN